MTYLKKYEGGTICWQNIASNRYLLLFLSITVKYYMNYKMLPIYKLISNTGPRHKPNFKVGVKLKNSAYVYSIGSSKKNAEQSAASELLKKI